MRLIINTILFIMSVLLLIGMVNPNLFLSDGNDNSLPHDSVVFHTDNPIINNKGFITTVKATVYNAVPSQCDDSPLVTASGRRIISTDSAYSHRYIAMSRDLLEIFNYGDKVIVSGTGEYDGVYTVADAMNRRHKNMIDILINPDMPMGVWDNVTITKLIDL